MMRYILMILTIFCGELFYKNHVESSIKEGSSRKVFRNMIILTNYHNRGAFLNVGEKKPAIIKAVSVILTILTAALFICSFGTVGKGMLKTGLSLLLGGAFSNTYDRIKRGYVVDYFRLNVPVKAVRRMIFNVSDFCIIIGAALIVLGK